MRFSAPVQTGPGVHPASYTMGVGPFAAGSKSAGGWRWPSTLSSAEIKERVALYIYSLSRPSWRVLGWNLPYFFASYFWAIFYDHVSCEGFVLLCIWGFYDIYKNVLILKCWFVLESLYCNEILISYSELQTITLPTNEVFSHCLWSIWCLNDLIRITNPAVSLGAKCVWLRTWSVFR
jgi:hypothetical protein